MNDPQAPITLSCKFCWSSGNWKQKSSPAKTAYFNNLKFLFDWYSPNMKDRFISSSKSCFQNVSSICRTKFKYIPYCQPLPILPDDLANDRVSKCSCILLMSFASYTYVFIRQKSLLYITFLLLCLSHKAARRENPSD